MQLLTVGERVEKELSCFDNDFDFEKAAFVGGLVLVSIFLKRASVGLQKEYLN